MADTSRTRSLASRKHPVYPQNIGIALSERPAPCKEPVDRIPTSLRRWRPVFLNDHIHVNSTICLARSGSAGALDHPDRVRQIVLFNTWMWSLRENRPARHS